MFSSCTIGNVHVYNYKPWQNNSLSIKLSVLSFTDDGNIAFFHLFSCLMKGSALNYSSARSSLYKSCYDWPLRVSWQCKRRRNLITLLKTQFRPKHSVLCMKLFYESNRPHFLWVYKGNNPLGMFGRTREKFVNHEPRASDLQTFRVFSQTSQVGYYPYKPTGSVVYCLNNT